MDWSPDPHALRVFLHYEIQWPSRDSTWTKRRASITKDCGVVMRRLAFCNATNSAQVAAQRVETGMGGLDAYVCREREFSPNPIRFHGQ